MSNKRRNRPTKGAEVLYLDALRRPADTVTGRGRFQATPAEPFEILPDDACELCESPLRILEYVDDPFYGNHIPRVECVSGCWTCRCGDTHYAYEPSCPGLEGRVSGCKIYEFKLD